MIFIAPTDTAAFEQFKAATSVLVTIGSTAIRVDLGGSGPAFDALLDCARRNVRQTSRDGTANAPGERAGSDPGTGSGPDAPTGGTNPFVRPDGGAPQRRAESAPGSADGGSNPFVRHDGEGPEKPRAGGGSGPFAPEAPGSRWQRTAPDAVAAAQRFVERLLTQAGFPDHRILTGADVPADSRHADVVWRIGAQIGTLLIVEARRYPSVVEASASIVKDASLACNEGFASTIAARRLRDDRPAAQMIVSCTRPTRFHANYTMVPVADTGYYRLTLITFGDPGEIDAMHERIGLALARVVPEE